MTRRALVVALLAAPLGLLSAALVWLLAEHGAGALGAAAVHEDGRRTLLATILYSRHFLREIAPTTLAVAACAGALLTYGPAGAPGARRRWAGVLAALMAVAAFCAAAAEAGVAVAAADLLQWYTRDDRGAYGSHWRSHLLAVVGLFAAAVVIAAVLGRLADGGWRRADPRTRRTWLGGVAAALAALTVLFDPTLEPFTAAGVVGHQARELATHGTITLAIAFAVLLALRRPAAPPAQAIVPPAEVVAAALIAAAVTIYLGVAALLLDAGAAAPAGAPLSALLAAHAFEHSLDYLFVALLCTWMSGWRSDYAAG
jgi:hypothetical protein